MPTLLVSAFLALGVGDAAAAGHHGREALDVRVFTKVGEPGHPDPIAVDRDRVVYVGTLTSFREMSVGRNDSPAPSRILAYGRTGVLHRQYLVSGQRLHEEHGLLGIAMDAGGLLYVTDANPARVFVLDPRTGRQRDYALFRDVKPCLLGGQPGDCSQETLDRDPLPNGATFGPDGSLYVTDYRQGLIWRVPSGGGTPEVWFTDPALASIPFALNGIRFITHGSALLFTQTNTNTPSGRLYKLPVHSDGSPGELELFYETRDFDGPDSFALAASGNVYVAMAGPNQLVKLSPSGEELARIPATPLDNAGQQIPFDVPADVAFLAESVLVTNSSFFAENPASWAVLDVFVGERGMPLVRPRVPAHPR
jgi:outer membrane protein assembly factor BamB